MAQATPQPTAAPATPARAPRSSLYQLFRTPVRRADDAQAVKLWEQYLAYGTDADFAALVEWYAPMVFVLAWRNLKDHPDYYAGSILDDLISDGCLGMMRLIAQTDTADPIYFQHRVKRRISKYMYNGVAERRFMGRRGAERQSVLSRERAKLVQDLGRVPTPQELLESLASHITNPQYYINDGPAMGTASQSRGMKGEMRGLADPSAESPEQKSMDADVVRLAMKGLDAQERKMLRLLLKGMAQADIAKECGLAYSTLRERLNGVLWKARCNAKLAEYLGVEPATDVPRTADRALPIQNVPPAKRAAG